MVIEDIDVIAAMVLYGGGFVAALGNAATYADDVNLARIKAAFPEYWASYADLAKARKGISE